MAVVNEAGFVCGETELGACPAYRNVEGTNCGVALQSDCSLTCNWADSGPN